MTTDRELLRRYAQENMEEAFTELVHRHVNLVYGAALRQLCGNTSLAEDVTQAVFTTLANKANAHSGISHLSAWLYATTRFTVSHTVRAERRRQNREQRALTMQTLTIGSGTNERPNVPPNLFDEVLETLDESEREAILLRFLEGNSFSEIALAFEVTEDAARMRVTRALDKARILFAKKGINSSAAAIGAAFANQMTAAPANLASSVSSVALSMNPALAASVSGKVGVTSIMSTTKTTVWLAGAIAILISAGTVYHWAHSSHSVSPHGSITPTRSLDQSGSNNRVALADGGNRRPAASATPSGNDHPQDRVSPAANTPNRGMTEPNVELERGVMRIQSLANVGCATPRAALESLLWAMAQGSKDELANMFILSQSQKEQLNAVLASLPEAARAEYSDPEHLLAVEAAFQGTIIPDDGVIQIVSETYTDGNDVSISFSMQGDKGTPPELSQNNVSQVEVLNGPDGWKIVVPNYAVTNFIGKITGNSGVKH